MFDRCSCRNVLRRGLTTVQTGLVLSVIVMVAIAGVRLMTQEAATDLDVTADGIADPAQLADRFK